MKQRWLVTLASLCLVLALAAPVGAELVKDVAVGFRVKQFDMTGDKNFIGSITDNNVDEKAWLYPTNLNMLFTFCPYGGLTLDLDRFGAAMSDDGSLYWNTISLALTPRVVLWDRVAPYGILGVTFNQVSFDEQAWWRYGFPSNSTFDNYVSQKPLNVGMADWMAAYSPSATIRDMSVDNAFGYTFGLGMDIFVTKHLAINLDARWNKAQTDVNYRIYQGDTKIRDTEFTYDLDTFSYGIGLRWYF